MTVVMIGKKNGKEALEFSFDYDQDAFEFYMSAKEHYREDDLAIVMLEEGEEG